MSKRKYTLLKFSPADDRQLTRFVKQNDILWNNSNRFECNKREELWSEIANTLKKSGI